MVGSTSGPWSCSRHQDGRLMFKVCSTGRRRSSSASIARPQVKATWSAISSRSLVIRYCRLWHPSSFAKVKMACSSLARRAGTSSCRERERREELYNSWATWHNAWRVTMINTGRYCAMVGVIWMNADVEGRPNQRSWVWDRNGLREKSREGGMLGCSKIGAKDWMWLKSTPESRRRMKGKMLEQLHDGHRNEGPQTYPQRLFSWH